MRASSTVRMIVVGGADEPLRTLLRDVLAEMGLRVEVVPLWHRSPDLVLAIVQRRDVTSVLAAAREAAAGAPIVALLPFSDDRLARRALENGAHAWYALDTPLAFFREEADALLSRGSPADAGLGPQ